MFIVNVEAKGMVAIHKYMGRNRLRYFKKEAVQKEIKSVQFSNHVTQKELEKFNEKLPILTAIGLGNAEEKKVDLYIDFARFGSKKPEYTILGNATLYNSLKHFID